MSTRKFKQPTNVVSLANFRQPPTTAVVLDNTVQDGLENARLVAEVARHLGVDLRLVAAIQRGDITPIA